MKLMCFSADRAGLLCSESLDAAMEGMRHHVAESRSAGTQWMPMPSSYDLRVTCYASFTKATSTPGSEVPAPRGIVTSP